MQLYSGMELKPQHILHATQTHGVLTPSRFTIYVCLPIVLFTSFNLQIKAFNSFKQFETEKARAWPHDYDSFQMRFFLIHGDMDDL